MGLSLDFAPDEGSEDDAGAGGSFAEMLERDPHYWPKDAGYDASVGILDVRRLSEVAEALAEIGFAETEIAGILGANFRRVAEQVWKVP